MAAASRIGDRAREIHRETPVIDLHSDTLLINQLIGYDFLKEHRQKIPFSPFCNHVDLPRARQGGATALGMGLVVSPVGLLHKMPTVRRQIAKAREWAKAADGAFKIALTAADIERGFANNYLTGFMGLEGAHGLDGDLDNLFELYALGARYVTITHFSSNEAAFAAAGLRKSNEAGLTAFGRELIRAMNCLGMMVDVAHVGRRSFLDVANVSRHPVFLSHTGVKGAYEHWRNIDDEQIRAVASRGGVIGIIFSPQFLNRSLRAGLPALLDHYEHLVKVGEVECAALGSDFDGFIFLPEGLRDISELPAITDGLLARGWKEDDIKKLLGLNFLRFMREVCG